MQNLNPHLHMLWVDGLYDVSVETPVFHSLAPTDEEIRELVEILSTRILKYLKKKGLYSCLGGGAIQVNVANGASCPSCPGGCP